MLKKHFAKARLIAGFLFAAALSAYAMQFEDKFDNSAYDSAIDSSKWLVSTGGTKAQNSATTSLSLTPDDADYALAAIATKQMFSIAGTDETTGTQIHIDIDDVQPSGPGVYTCITDVMICSSAVVPATDFWAYDGAALCLQFEWIGSETLPTGRHITVAAYQKEAGNPGSMGVQIFHGQDWINQSGELPLDFDIVINEKYFEFVDNGNRWGGATSMAQGFSGGMAALQIVMRNTQSEAGGRGSMKLGQVAISDAHAAGFIGPKTEVRYDFNDTAFDNQGFSNYVLFWRAGWGDLKQIDGSCQFWSATNHYGHYLTSRDGIIPGGQNNSAVFSCSVKSIEPSTDEIGALIGITSGPSPWHLWAPWPPASVWATASTSNANSNSINLNVYSKPWSGAPTQLVSNQKVTITGYPFTFQIEVNNAGKYSVAVGGEVVAHGSNHTANFDMGTQGDYSCVSLGGMQNIASGRGIVTLDDFLLKSGEPAPQVNKAANWDLY